MSEKLLVSLEVNGEAVEQEAEPRTLLSTFIRDGLGLTGTHVGCEHGICGACTVDLNGVLGLSPLELLLASLGSCSAVDFALLMRKQRDPVEPLRIEVDGDKEDTRMQWLRVTYHVHVGPDPIKVERARSKTATDLCTVSRTLSDGCPVEHVIA